MISILCTIIVAVELFIAILYIINRYFLNPLSLYLRRAKFKIIREDNVYRIHKKILLWYRPMAEVNSFTDCLQLFSNYCSNTYHNNVKVYDPKGPNKIMSIVYDKKVNLNRLPRYDVIVVKPLDNSILFYYDYLKQRIIDLLN